MKILSFNFI